MQHQDYIDYLELETRFMHYYLHRNKISISAINKIVQRIQKNYDYIEQLKQQLSQAKNQEPVCHYCEDNVNLNAEGYHYWHDTVENCIEEIKCRKYQDIF